MWAIPCQRSEKIGQRRKVDFFDEICNIIWQFDNFGPFFFTIFKFFWLFLPNMKNTFNYCFEKVKIDTIAFFILFVFSTTFQISYIQFF